MKNAMQLKAIMKAISAKIVWEFSADSLGKNRFTNLTRKAVFYKLYILLIAL